MQLEAGALADDYKLGDLSIAAPVARTTAPGAKVGGGYLTITKNGTQADCMVAATAPFPVVWKFTK